MKKYSKKYFCASIILLSLFVLWTVAVCFIDVSSIGPQNSNVGFATINNFIHRFFGVNMLLYTITDWLGLVPVAVGFSFAVLGLVQWIKRKSLMKVDYSLFICKFDSATARNFHSSNSHALNIIVCNDCCQLF